MHTDSIVSTLHKFSEIDWPVQILLSKTIYDAKNSQAEASAQDKIDWEGIPSEKRINTLCDCIGMLVCEIDRIGEMSEGSKSVDEIMEGLVGKPGLVSLKSDSPALYNSMCAGFSRYASQKCSEQRRNVLNHLTKTPFFIKHRSEFPRSLILQAPEPKV